MLEWIPVSKIVLPHVLKFAKDRAKKLAEKSTDSALHAAYLHLIPDATLAAVNQAFFKRFSLELENSDFKTFTAGRTKDDLARFLSNPAVQSLIQAPLDAHSTIDPQLLSGIWSEMGLITLSLAHRR